MSHWNQIIEWNVDQVAELRALWASGLSTRLIGLRLGVSKNSIIGKANRLHLPPRPSPVERAAVIAAKRARMALPDPSPIAPPTKAQLMGRR